jgi:hypothetical protein
MSVDVAERTVSGIRSSVTTGGDACPFPFEDDEKFWPLITRWPFASSYVALVITSCGAGVAAAVVTRALTISAPTARTVVNNRFGSNICDPPVSPLRFAR